MTPRSLASAPLEAAIIVATHWTSRVYPQGFILWGAGLNIKSLFSIRNTVGFWFYFDISWVKVGVYGCCWWVTLWCSSSGDHETSIGGDFRVFKVPCRGLQCWAMGNLDTLLQKTSGGHENHNSVPNTSGQCSGCNQRQVHTTRLAVLRLARGKIRLQMASCERDIKVLSWTTDQHHHAPLTRSGGAEKRRCWRPFQSWSLGEALKQFFSYLPLYVYYFTHSFLQWHYW